MKGAALEYDPITPRSRFRFVLNAIACASFRQGIIAHTAQNDNHHHCLSVLRATVIIVTSVAVVPLAG